MTKERFISGTHTYGDIRIMSRQGCIRTGKYCSISDNVRAVMVGHNTGWITTYPFPSREMRAAWPGSARIQGHPRFMGDIRIGNDVWIGSDVLLLGGITIADGAIIGAGSVVDEDIPPYAIAVGNRAKVIRYRFDPHQIDMLRDIRWWDWPEEKIIDNLPLLCSMEVDQFILQHYQEVMR